MLSCNNNIYIILYTVNHYITYKELYTKFNN